MILAPEVVCHVDVLFHCVVEVVLNPKLELTPRVQGSLGHPEHLVRFLVHFSALYLAFGHLHLNNAGFGVHVHAVEVAFGQLELPRFDDDDFVASGALFKHHSAWLVELHDAKLVDEVGDVLQRPGFDKWDLAQETGLCVYFLVAQATHHRLVQVSGNLHTECLSCRHDFKFRLGARRSSFAEDFIPKSLPL